MEAMERVEITEAPPRKTRFPGDNRHTLVFGAVTLALAIVGTLAFEAALAYMTPPPPFEIDFLSDAEAIHLLDGSRSVKSHSDREVWLYVYLNEDPGSDGPASFPGPGEGYTLPEHIDVDRAWDSAIGHAEAVRHVRERMRLVMILLAAVILGALATRVAYRVHDGLLLFLGGLGAMYIVPKVLWRITSPARYWEGSPDDLPRAPAWARFSLGIGIVAWTLILGLVIQSVQSRLAQ